LAPEAKETVETATTTKKKRVRVSPGCRGASLHDLNRPRKEKHVFVLFDQMITNAFKVHSKQPDAPDLDISIRAEQHHPTGAPLSHGGSASLRGVTMGGGR